MNKKIIYLLFFVISVGLVDDSYADTNNIGKKIASHLEFLGYNIKIKKVNTSDVIIARHEKYFNFIIKETSKGILFQSFFSSDEFGENKDILKIINGLNSRSVLIKCCFYNDKITLESIYLGDYDKEKFGFFINLIRTEQKKLVLAVNKYKHN